MTEYVVLRFQRLFGDVKIEGGAWVEIGRVFARSSSSAIRERLDGAAQTDEYTGEGEYSAVPVRSWKPVTVKVETKTALKFS